ncbi:MAG: arginine--tRNA ligase [Bacilli bacterium]|nr:arginine--tRNA ligase [Bacilli bacterium]
MEVKELLKTKIKDALNKLGVDLDINQIDIENSKDPTHGDYASNVALKNARLVKKPPVELAKMIEKEIDMDGIDKIEIAGPGFINFYMAKGSITGVIKKIFERGDDFGRGEKKNCKVNVEFVSANPTGDLHVGHARGAAIGDSISRILEFDGYDVTREYYINDAGNQIDHLAESILERLKEALGMPFDLPADGYHGEDVRLVALAIKDELGDRLPECLKEEGFIEELKLKGMELELEKIRIDLKTYGIVFDVFSSEKAMRANGAVEKEIEYLSDHIYVDDGAKYLRTTDFLDDKDRVIVKRDGSYTYFLPDIVYHVNKLSRGFDKLIDVLGADHHGYINRMKSALMMHGYSSDALEIELIQMVRMMRDGEEFKLSKRTGNGYTLRELCEDVGVDAARYFFVMRAASGHLDFDLDLAVKQSSDNPVYYAQYAHARLCAVLEKAEDISLDVSCSHLSEQSELDLVKQLSLFPDAVKSASKERAPYKITNYIHDVAEKVHSFYTECRVIDRDNIEVTSSRLALCQATKIVLKNALHLVGVSAPEHM